MKIFWRKWMKQPLLFLVMIAMLLAGCTGTSPVVQKTGAAAPTPAATALPTRDPNIVPDMKIDTVMLGENPRDPGGIAMVLSLQPNVDAPNTNVTITMPSDAVILTGSQAWAGDLKADQGLYLNLTIQIDALSKPGEIKIESVSYPKDKPKLEKVYRLYVRPVQNGKLEFSKTPFTN
jgi:hypothetical protein